MWGRDREPLYREAPKENSHFFAGRVRIRATTLFPGLLGSSCEGIRVFLMENSNCPKTNPCSQYFPPPSAWDDPNSGSSDDNNTPTWVIVSVVIVIIIFCGFLFYYVWRRIPSSKPLLVGIQIFLFHYIWRREKEIPDPPPVPPHKPLPMGIPNPVTMVTQG
ncbi:uncharacterized protein LOC115731271 [Rhodamnia argentea]|uniref:Uncharacterized protein LOC115731271 n=1 Tax=Rhodamnia argentea TaxID=178133 RepID=A0A8B8N5S9_9MYRT|nr:uncharacterized protein LOC115731271 [Rhodamnia argentea]